MSTVLYIVSVETYIEVMLCVVAGEPMVDEIDFYFRKEEYGWLSNFERAPQIIGSVRCATNEHWYQHMKARDSDMRKWILNAPKPHAAMTAGRGLREHEVDPGWDDDRRVHIMLIGLRAKFHQNPELKQKLLDTGDAILHEDSPTDMFWGKKGKDMLGKLLMQVREEIRSGSSFDSGSPELDVYEAI